MDVPHGIGLFVLGMIVTVAFFIFWFKALESEENKTNKNDDYSERV